MLFFRNIGPKRSYDKIKMEIAQKQIVYEGNIISADLYVLHYATVSTRWDHNLKHFGAQKGSK